MVFSSFFPPYSLSRVYAANWNLSRLFSEVTGTASASKMSLNWLKSLQLSQRSEVTARCIYKVNNWWSWRVCFFSPETCWQSLGGICMKAKRVCIMFVYLNVDSWIIIMLSLLSVASNRQKAGYTMDKLLFRSRANTDRQTTNHTHDMPV